jgi:hypothetical protein
MLLCSFEVGRHSCQCRHVLITVKYSSGLVQHTRLCSDILKCPSLKELMSTTGCLSFHLRIICFCQNADTNSPFWSLASFTHPGNSFLLLLSVPPTSLFLAKSVSTSLGLVNNCLDDGKSLYYVDCLPVKAQFKKKFVGISFQQILLNSWVFQYFLFHRSKAHFLVYIEFLVIAI